MPDTTVKYFDSTMSGAPALSGTAGALIGVLDACLVNGFGSITLDSLVIVSNVATGTISTGHGFAMVGDTGPVIKIEGATPSGLNGEWRLASVPTANTFTFATSGITDQTATGTISAKRAPAGFEKAFTGTNKAAYRSLDVESTQLYLQVNDTAAQFPTVQVFESMTDVDTGSGASGILYMAKSAAANSTAVSWVLYADTCAFYLIANSNYCMFFGDIVSLLIGDSFHCALIGHNSMSVGTSNLHLLNETTGSVIAKEYTQVGSAVGMQRISHEVTPTMGTGGAPFPNAAGSNLLINEVTVWNSTNAVCRGVMPGFYNPLHTAATLVDRLVTSGVVIRGVARDLILQQLRTTSNYAAMDLTGPWRS